MTTEEAFGILLGDPELVKKTGMSDVHKRALRKKLKDKQLGHDIMAKYLMQAGFTEYVQWWEPDGYKKAEVETSAV